MRFLRWAFVVFLLLVSLATWVPRIRIAGVGPDLLLGVVVVFALGRGMQWGVWIGVFLGLLIGIEQPVELGRDCLALALAGAFVGRGSLGLDRKNPLVIFMLLFLASFLADFTRLFWVARGDLGALPYLAVRWALPGAIYTTLALPLVAWVASRLLGRREWMPSAP